MIAIENVRLFDEVQAQRREVTEALEHQTATSEVLNVISRSPTNAQPVFDAIVESAARLCEALFSVVWRYEGDLLHYAASHNFTPEVHHRLLQAYPKRPDRSLAAGRAILDGAVAQVPDMLADPTYAHEFALAGNWRASVAVPMLRDGKPVGAISVGKAEAVPFSERQIQLLTTFADQAVIAIENVRLLDEVRQRTDDLSEALEQQTATSEVLGVISSSPGELKPVFRTILENATRICDAKFGTLFRYDGEMFHRVAGTGTPPAFVEFQIQRGPFKPEVSPRFSRMMRTKAVEHTVDELEEPVPGPPATLGGARSVVSVPMLKENELVGAIIIYRQEVRPFTDKQIELVQNFAAQAVIAIENTRLLNELRESLQQQTATADVLKVISRSTFDLQTVLDTLVEFGGTAVRGRYGYYKSPTGWHLPASCPVRPHTRARGLHGHYPIPLGADRWSDGRFSKARVHIPDILADPEYTFRGAAQDQRRPHNARCSIAARRNTDRCAQSATDRTCGRSPTSRSSWSTSSPTRR